jgi:hypothetical protein
MMIYMVALVGNNIIDIRDATPSLHMVDKSREHSPKPNRIKGMVLSYHI